MDKILKFLQKLSAAQRKTIDTVICSILLGHLEHLDISKVQGYTDLYRIRQGKIRILFRKTSERNIIINIDRRGNAYKDL